MKSKSKHLKKRSGLLKAVVFALLLLFLPLSGFAHCDSYDGPVIKDAFKALEAEKVEPVLKWIEPEFESEIKALFNKTIKYKSGDQEVYQLLEEHFLETLVRVHREGEGEPYTGLKPAGSMSQIISMSDSALAKEEISPFLEKLNAHLGQVIQEKYEKASRLQKTKNQSVELGRAYVAAYVDYTHTIEALHSILEGGAGHNH